MATALPGENLLSSFTQEIQFAPSITYTVPAGRYARVYLMTLNLASTGTVLHESGINPTRVRPILTAAGTNDERRDAIAGFVMGPGDTLRVNNSAGFYEFYILELEDV